MVDLFPHEVLRLGPFVLTDTVIASAGLSLFLVFTSVVCLRIAPAREVLEVVYEYLEGAIERMVSVDARSLVPLVLTQWLFIVSANLVGLLPGLSSPTRDLSLAAALAAIAWLASHVFALRSEGWGYHGFW